MYKENFRENLSINSDYISGCDDNEIESLYL